MGDPTPEVLDLEYTYDDVSGNILGITDVVDPDRTAGYAYDALDRLVGADGWWGSLDWTYDKTGNRLSETRDGTASTYIYEPGTSRLATVTGGSSHELAYDASGNAIRYDDLCLDYDAADRLVSIRRLVDPAGCGADRTGACSTCATTVVQENGYDWKFRRVRRVEYVDEAGLPLSTPRCTAFVYDLYDRLIAEHDGSADASTDPAANVVAEYVYLEGYHVLAVRRSGQWYWYANDHLATPRKLVDAAGAVVWDGRMEPFGVTDEVVAAVAQPLRFPGQVGDRMILLSTIWMRMYVPWLGRFLSPEPGGLGRGLWGLGPIPLSSADHLMVASASTYAYVTNRPVISCDPTGLPYAHRFPEPLPPADGWLCDTEPQFIVCLCWDTCFAMFRTAFEQFRRSAAACARGDPASCQREDEDRSTAAFIQDLCTLRLCNRHESDKRFRPCHGKEQ